MEDIGGYSNANMKKARLQSMLSTLLDDPVLKDVPKNPSVADVDTLINLELGSAMKVSVLRMDNSIFDVAIPNSATVGDLKSAVVKKVNEMEQSQMGHRHISWYILFLMLHREYLEDIHEQKSVVSFMV